jgi:hypothetical protein
MKDIIPLIVPNDIEKHVTHHYADNNGIHIQYASIGTGPLIVRLLVYLAQSDGRTGPSLSGRRP